MTRGEMLTVFSYDVSDDRRRRKIAAMLEDWATRVQFSVFECRMTSAQAEALSRRLATRLGQGDSLRVYAVSHSGEARSRVFGETPALEAREGYWLL